MEDLNELTYKIIGACVIVHKNLGPGLLESVYQECLVEELKRLGLRCKENVPVKIVYKGKQLEKCFFVDILVEDKVIIELKAVENMNPVYKAQLLTYLKLSEISLGLLINFNVIKLIDGVSRIVNNKE